MRKIMLVLVMSLAMVVAFGISDSVIAKNTIACPNSPTGLTCTVDTVDGVTLILADWVEVNCSDGKLAEKYSVSVNAGYDTDGDNVADTYVEFDFGTSDRIDGDPMSQSDLDIPVADLDTDVDGDAVIDSPIEAELKVKGLSHYAKRLRQNNEWSTICVADLS